jgi:DNA ligase (NAD+)
MNKDELAKQIVEHRRAYYDGHPTISDAEFDALEDRLRTIAPDHWALSAVGSNAGTVAHSSTMLSANKAKDVETVVRWAGQKRLAWGYKIDGMSLELIYVDGFLAKAITRGDGLRGDDVTEHAKHIIGLPRTISLMGIVIVRGEAYIPLSQFHADGEYKSPRNLVSGSFHSRDPRDVETRRIRFMAWDMIDEAKSVVEKIIFYKENGFECADQGPVDVDRIETIYNSVLNDRDQYDFEMDGLVFKYDSLIDRASAGETEHHPKWLIAFKFPSTEATTVIRRIDWQVGRTGKITPVATVEPVELAGATITHVTLHNARFVADNDIGIDDRVSIVRSGDVIPKILGVVESSGRPAMIPPICPRCGEKVTDNGVDLTCTNPSCASIALRKIEYFVATVGIDNLGTKTIKKLWDAGKVRHPAQLYTLDPTYLQRELGANGAKIYKNIQIAKTIGMDVFIAALGIPSLGLPTARMLVAGLDDVMDITNEHIEQLCGPTIARTIITNLGDRSLFEPYRAVGIEIVPYKQPVVVVAGSPIAGKRIYITGSVDGYKKDDLEGLVTGAGGIWTSSVSKNMDYLVLGDNYGPSKRAKADELIAGGAKIELMSVEKFMRLIGK